MIKTQVDVVVALNTEGVGAFANRIKTRAKHPFRRNVFLDGSCVFKLSFHLQYILLNHLACLWNENLLLHMLEGAALQSSDSVLTVIMNCTGRTLT